MIGPLTEPPQVGSGEFLTRFYESDAGRRDYKLYVPVGDRAKPRSLIVMLHGCTQSPDDFAIGTEMNALADVHQFLVAYPAQTASANPSRCWNWYDPRHQRRGGEPSIIAGMVREIETLYAIDPRRIYAAGLSAGGAAAAVLGAAYPDVFAAIGVHSGLARGDAHDLASAFSAMKGRPSAATRGAGKSRQSESPTRIPTIVFHGDRDRTVHPSNGERILDLNGAADLTPRVMRGCVAGGRAYTRTSYADAAGRPIHELWTVHGADHAWSGGAAPGTYTDPQGPSASQEMIRFFLAHPRPEPVPALHD
ncbi:MAG: PHB depolymerase family esterase [Candidatus Baltobacteraceae bacterium]